MGDMVTALWLWAFAGPILAIVWTIAFHGPTFRARRNQAFKRKLDAAGPAIWEAFVRPTGYDHRVEVVVRQVKRVEGRAHEIGNPIRIATIDPTSRDYEPEQVSAAVDKAMTLAATLASTGAAS